ncbi:uncharacterized protein LOC110431946 [Sorghum bicolor]|uniref:uncharacterized protein LOC110431946 n=1 Tax=Sorghum bicolor TaxID=4558 RepID=UPI000B426614|nr:uncharacterized protein LOC110431946 [Sorghum bicolor]|eukprot:XP_021307479.1 uncharacterized protein LOC110431946 [Sorghum bicolor]
MGAGSGPIGVRRDRAIGHGRPRRGYEQVRLGNANSTRGPRQPEKAGGGYARGGAMDGGRKLVGARPEGARGGRELRRGYGRVPHLLANLRVALLLTETERRQRTTVAEPRLRGYGNGGGAARVRGGGGAWLGFEGGTGGSAWPSYRRDHPRFACGRSDRAVAMASASHGAAGKKAAPADKQGPRGGEKARAQGASGAGPRGWARPAAATLGQL